jgi:hypothetical protein
MTKKKQKEIHDAMLKQWWRRFDRSSAYACARRGEPFDEGMCRMAWQMYCHFETVLGIANAQSPFVVDTLKLPSY